MTDTHITPSSVRANLYGLITTVRAAVTKRREFNTTFRELNGLTDRELADLGIARSNIKQVAYDTAYGA
ncbi:MAG: DUF1127 domain-containing protein [Pseudomonadota bacterium]